MLTADNALDRATDLIARACKAGADACDVVYGASASRHVSARLGLLEDVGSAEGAEVGLRVFVGTRSATASTSDFSTAALDTLVERTLAMARLAPADPYAGLAPPELLSVGPFNSFDTDDGGEASPEELRHRALLAEGHARSVPGVTNSQGGSAGVSRSVHALATSTGFAGANVGSSHSVSASVLAGEGAGMQRDYAFHSARHLSDLDDPAKVGREAGERAVARLGPARLKSGAMPILFDPRVGPSLLGALMGAISGASVARKTSFLLDSLEMQIFDTSVMIIDDPWLPRGFRSRSFDGEGLTTKPRALVDKGMLTSWIAECASARQIGIEPTGHASRGISGAPGASATNLRMEAGSVAPQDLMADIADGFYVTELIGMGVNGLTGDYSRGASGFRIVEGELKEAVSEVTIAGNLKTMFANLIPADDLTLRFATNTPTVRIEGMMVAGD